MEVEYSLTAEDFRALASYHRRLRSVRPVISPLAVLGVVIVTMVASGGAHVGIASLGALRGDFFVPYLLGLAFGAIGQALALRWWQGYVQRATWKTNCEDKRNEWAIQHVRAIVSPNELCTVTRGSTSTHQWSLVWRIGVIRSHVFLYISTTNAILIPRRAFRDDSHFEEFVALARHYQQSLPPRGAESDVILDT